MREPDFAAEVALCCKIHYANVNQAAEMAAITAALATDNTTHDRTIEAPAAGSALVIGEVNGIAAPTAGWHTRFGNDIILLINEAKGAGLNNSQIISGLDDALGVIHKPGVIDVPYASANASPPIVGTVVSCTNGNWTGAPTGYTYQWTRDGTNIGAATAATNTLVSADIGGNLIRCVVTATNAQGSTIGPPSNAIGT
jgi:hypothetical protein